MLFKIFVTLCAVSITSGDLSAPFFDTSVSDGVKSVGSNIVYADEDMTVLNQVVNEFEKSDMLKSKVNLIEAIKPLPAEDVKCLMSVDRYCSKQMGAMKKILIQAVKEDCEKCTQKQKDDAGQVIASMLAHDPVAWKLFLTRTAIHLMPERNNQNHNMDNHSKYTAVGEPEIIESSKNRYTMPGFRVRVKRYAMEPQS